MIKKNVKDIRIVLIIGIIILILFINNNYKKSSDIGLHIHYYKNGVEVFPVKSLFSIVIKTTPGVDYDALSFTISAKNTGNTDLTLKIVNASPSSFKDALPTNTRILLQGENKILWSSSVIPIVQFETFPQPIRFWYNISATSGTLNQSSEGYIDLIILSSSLIIFRTNINQSLDSSPYSPAKAYVIYSSTTGTDGYPPWIAFDKNGDAVMEKYGPISNVISLGTFCNDTANTILLYMPFKNYTNNNGLGANVWILNSTTTGEIKLCYNAGLGTSNNSEIRTYSTTAPGASNALDSGISIGSYANGKQERHYAPKAVQLRVSNKVLNGDSGFKQSIAVNLGCNLSSLVLKGEYDGEKGSDTSNRNCLTYMPLLGYIKLLDIPEGIITQYIVGTPIATTSFSLWYKNNTSPATDDYVICGVQISNGRAVYQSFRSSQIVIDEVASTSPFQTVPFNYEEVYC